MKVRLAPRAIREAKRIKTWWVANRPEAPERFDDELTIALEQIEATPTLGSLYGSEVDPPIRRLLMPTTENHVYYTIHDDEIVIVSVWGAPRRRGPKLRATPK